MSKEEADKTEIGKRRSEMFNALVTTMDVIEFSPNTISAILASVIIMN